MAEKSSGSGGASIGTIVFIVFLVLKLLEIEPVGSWSWWWVTSPLWIGYGFWISLIAFGFLSVGFFALVDKIFAGKKVKLDDLDD